MLQALRRAATSRPRTALFLALTYVNGATFLFHALVSRRMDNASEYGALGSVLVLTVLVANGTGALTAAVTRTVAFAGPRHHWDIDRLNRLARLAALASLVVGVAVSPVLERYLHLSNPLPIVMLAVLTAATLLELAPRGVLMGQHRFLPVSCALGAGATVRLLFGVALAVPWGVTGAMAGVALGECVVAAWCIRAVRDLDDGSEREVLRIPRRSVTLATGAYTSLWLLAASDTFLARHLLGGHDSGLYVAASTAGSIALFMPNNVTLAAFPGLAGDAARGEPATGEFSRALAFATALTLLASGGLALFPGLVIAILYGPHYADAAALLTLLAFSNGAQGLVGFLQHHQLAHHRATCLLPWAGLIVFGAIAITSAHTSTQLAWEAVATAAVLLVVMTGVSLRLHVTATVPEADPDDLAVSLR